MTFRSDVPQGPSQRRWPPSVTEAATPTPDLSLVVGRALGTVVVTVHGELNVESCQRLETLLIDLIEGQGNLAVAVDLARATIEPEALIVFIDAAHRASLHGTKFTLEALPPDTHEALRSGGLSDSVEVMPLRRRR